MAPVGFQEAALLGRWENTFTTYHTETLLLTADHRFEQIFDVPAIARREHGLGTWYVEQRASGCVYLHLNGMRYFHGAESLARHGNRFTPNGDPYAFSERCERRRLPMPDKLILLVTNRPTWPRGIGLTLPSTSDDPSSSEALQLVADEYGQPLPPSPAPEAVGDRVGGNRFGQLATGLISTASGSQKHEPTKPVSGNYSSRLLSVQSSPTPHAVDSWTRGDLLP